MPIIPPPSGGGGGGGKATQNITTGASPVTLSLDTTVVQTIVNVTSGGTAGTEKIYLNQFPLDANFQNNEQIGYTVIIALQTQTNGSDAVHVIPFDGSIEGSFDWFGSFNNQYLEARGLVVPILDYAGACVAFIWNGETWRIYNNLTNRNFDGTFGSHQLNIATADSDGVSLAGQLQIIAGSGNGTINGGDISISAGSAGLSSKAGNIYLLNLPTSAVGLPSQALYNNAGIVTIAP